MILYSIMPKEWIFPPQYDELQNYITVDMQGVSMVVRPTEGMKEYEIISLQSTNPYDYLQYSPGQRITYE